MADAAGGIGFGGRCAVGRCPLRRCEWRGVGWLVWGCGKGGNDGKSGWGRFGVFVDITDGWGGVWLVGGCKDGKDSWEGWIWFGMSLRSTVVMMVKVRNDGYWCKFGLSQSVL